MKLQKIIVARNTRDFEARLMEVNQEGYGIVPESIGCTLCPTTPGFNPDERWWAVVEKLDDTAKQEARKQVV